MVQTLFDVMLREAGRDERGKSLAALLDEHGFDRNPARADPLGLEGRTDRIGAEPAPGQRGDRRRACAGCHGFDRRRCALTSEAAEAGQAALRRGEVTVVTLAAGAGSRWTQGAGVGQSVASLRPARRRHRTFLELHLAKSRRVSRQVGMTVPHLFTTSYLTHEPIEEFLARQGNYGYEGPLVLSPGKAVGLRMIPTVRDLRFLWEEMPQQILDEQQQKVRDSLRTRSSNGPGHGEASDYTDNLPLQCLHPVGHWYEVPNLFRNGVLAQLLAGRPQLKYLMLHNIDTCGADVDPALLGQHLRSGRV